jgi:hypothetical protein
MFVGRDFPRDNVTAMTPVAVPAMVYSDAEREPVLIVALTLIVFAASVALVIFTFQEAFGG